jgi:hypothetical protein
MSHTFLLNLLSHKVDLVEVMVVQDLGLPSANGRAKNFPLHCIAKFVEVVRSFLSSTVPSSIKLRAKIVTVRSNVEATI